MPLKVSTTLSRLSATYLAGETLECTINFECFTGEETVAWASAQVHCQQVVDQNLFHRLNKKTSIGRNLSQTDVTSGATSFVANIGEPGHTIYSSQPEVICCNFTLKDGEIRQFTYKSCLPMGIAPPSYKGVFVKYSYKLTIGVQTVQRAVKLLKVPFRMLAITGCNSEEFLRSHTSPLESANCVIELATGQQSPKKFCVADEKGQVCSISMPKKCFRLGEDICILFNFDHNSLNLCTQFFAMLQTVEEICAENDANGATISESEKFESTLCEQRECCAFYENCQVRLHIPISAAPSFFTDFAYMRCPALNVTDS